MEDAVDFLKQIKRVFLAFDENVSEMERELKIMRMLQYKYEDEMNDKRRERSNCSHLPKSKLNRDGTIKK